MYYINHIKFRLNIVSLDLLSTGVYLLVYIDILKDIAHMQYRYMYIPSSYNEIIRNCFTN